MVGAAAPVLMNSRGRNLPLALERLRSAPPVRGLVGEAVELPPRVGMEAERGTALRVGKVASEPHALSSRRLELASEGAFHFREGDALVV